jgi:hypothetical protein
MPAWTNFVAINAARNGTTTHTVNPSAGIDVVAGSAFTPTAGRLLVIVTDAAVTSSTPAGWTLPAGGNAVNFTGLYVWHRLAAGSDTFSTTHNAPNCPAMFTILEFPATSAFFASVAATAQTATAANPTLPGLTGTTQVFGAAGWADNVTGGTTGSATWNSPNTELVDYNDLGADSYWFGLCYQENYAAASYAPTPTITVPAAGSGERLTFAVTAPAGAAAGARNLASLGVGL